MVEGEEIMDYGLVICPECDGRKRSMAHLNTTSGHRWECVSCLSCDGMGHVRQGELDKWRDGERMRVDRKARKVTLREEAARLGISAKELSDREWGRS